MLLEQLYKNVHVVIVIYIYTVVLATFWLRIQFLNSYVVTIEQDVLYV